VRLTKAPAHARLLRFAFPFIPFAIAACSTTTSASAPDDTPVELPAECGAYFASYSRCAAKLGPQASSLASSGELRAREALSTQAREADGEARVRAQCVDAMKQLASSCR